MDFAFVPRGGKPDVALGAAANFLGRRIGGTGMVPGSKSNLRDILDWVDISVPSGDEVGKLFLVSHASEHHVSFAFTSTQTDPSVYQVLIDLPGAIPPFRVPVRFRTPPATGAPRIQLMIKGCRIGQSEAFLRVFKTLMGGEVEITAPRHFNDFVGISDKSASHIFECLSYNLEVHRKDPITKQADLAAAFTGAGFTRYDASPFPAAAITDLTDQLGKPPYRRTTDYLPGKSSEKELKLPLKLKVKFPEAVTGRTVLAIPNIAQYRAQRVRKTIARMDLPSFGSKPIKDHVDEAVAAWETKYRHATVTGGTVEKTYWENFGLLPGEDPRPLVTFDDFEDVDKATRTKGRKITGTFFRYQLIMPVLSATDDTLLFDSETLTGTALTNPTTWPTDATQRAALFRTV
jgi:hypothetical protein